MLYDFLNSLGHIYATYRIFQDSGIWMIEAQSEQIRDYLTARLGV